VRERAEVHLEVGVGSNEAGQLVEDEGCLAAGYHEAPHTLVAQQ
jgi:hypothetical protein